MTQYQIEYRTPLHAPNDLKKTQEHWLHYQVADKLVELIFEEDRTDWVCISPIKLTKEEGYGLYPEVLNRFSVNVDYSRSVPVLLPSYAFPIYRGKEIKPPNELTFVERVKFIFTGKYPAG